MNDLRRLINKLGNDTELEFEYADHKGYIEAFDVLIEDHEQPGYLYATLSNHSGEYLIGICTPDEAIRLVRMRMRVFSN